MNRFSVLLLSVFVFGCGKYSPKQGFGAIYTLDHGDMVCVDVKSVTFVSSRFTEYETLDGRVVTTTGLVDYYAGEACK